MEFRYAPILDYWFGPLDAEDDYPLEKSKLWFRKDDSVDAFIRNKFAQDLDKIATLPIKFFLEDPERALGAIILFDQFTRNSFRGTPQAYDYDRDALEISRKGIELGVDQNLKTVVERVFFYMPLMHAEIKSVQKLSVKKFKGILEDATPKFKTHAESFMKFAQMHADIVNKFGRFPHRNQILNRPSTEEELAFLKTPGSSF